MVEQPRCRVLLALFPLLLAEPRSRCDDDVDSLSGFRWYLFRLPVSTLQFRPCLRVALAG